MENSITINNITYDFIINDNKGNIFGMGQNCVKCEVPKVNDTYCKICNSFNILTIIPNFKVKKEHYFVKRN